MGEGLNKVMLLGNLGADPELRFTQAGQAVLSLRIATTETYLDKDKVRKERTDWHSVVVWGKRGEALAKILGKGSSLFVEGSLRTSSYDDRDGNRRYKTEVIASNVLLTGGRRSGSESDATAPQDEGDARAPGNSGYPTGRSAKGADKGNGGYNGGGGYSRGGSGGGGGGYGPPAQGDLANDNYGGYGGGSDDDIPFAFCEGASAFGDAPPNAVTRRR